MSTLTPIEDQHFEDLLKLIKKRRLKVNITRLRRAFQFAKKAHEGQYRMSGVPYICHPVAVAAQLVELHMDEESLIAAMLHDVPEDTSRTVEDIQKRFGKTIARLVDALTKLSKVYYKHSMNDRQVQSLRKMFFETSNDVRVAIIKLADRLHNMSTLQYLRPDKQQRIAKETMEIYAPLANLYGIYQLRRKLEDYCFMYLQPEEYAKIESFVYDHEKKREAFIKDVIRVLKRTLKKASIKAEFQGRPKHYYSIYQKTIRNQKVLKDIYDYFAIRIITEDVPNCYNILGLVHETFKPKPGRFKDYIALPKPNGYQSIHTTVVGLRGKLTEIQIRTRAMHEEAEYGAAAHIMYKKPKAPFVMNAIEELKKYKNPESFIKGLQEDLLNRRIYVFSPKGEIINLPEGATVLDYVFSVDLPVDQFDFRAVVNRKSYSLRGELQSGDHVEIIYSKQKREGPDRAWLEHVKTTRAKKAIQSHFNTKSLQSKVKMGETLLQQELDHENEGPIYQLPASRIKIALKKYEKETFKDLLAQIGVGEIDSQDVYRVMFPELKVNLVDRICLLAKKLTERFRRSNEQFKYRIRIHVACYDRVGLLREILQPLHELNIPILKLNWVGFDLPNRQPTYNPKHITNNSMDVLIENHAQLISLFDRIEKVPGIVQVNRGFKRNQVAFTSLALLTAIYFVGHPFFFLLVVDWANIQDNRFWLQLLIYGGLGILLILMGWLRAMGSRTFPHFEETKWFWPLAFSLTVLAIVMLFVDDAVFELSTHLPVMVGISLVILLGLYLAYLSHERRLTRHLTILRKRGFKLNRKAHEAGEMNEIT